jgi:hypothetical protein
MTAGTDEKPGCCWLKHTGCSPADDEDCQFCARFGWWPEDWWEMVESYLERNGGEIGD